MTERYGCDEWWAPYPGASNYQFSGAGRVRSIDRTISGRFYKGQLLATRPSNRPVEAAPEDRYRLVNIRLDDGTRKTVSVHSGVMLSRTEGGARPVRNGVALVVCHGDDVGSHNWWANLRWDDDEGNRVDRYGEHVRKVPQVADRPQANGHIMPVRHVPWLRRVLAKITKRPVTKSDRTPIRDDYAA